MALERGGGGGRVTSAKKSSAAKVTYKPKTASGGGVTYKPKVSSTPPPLQGRGGYSVAQASTGLPFNPDGSVGGGGGNYGGGGGGGGYGSSVAPPVVTPPSEEDYLAGDSGYTTQLSALQSALQRYIADSDFQRKNYETDYGKSLRDLGYDEGKKAWNWTDQLTASGRGYQNQLNDFGARGMLQSSGYADAFNELQRMLNQQYDSLSNAKTTYMTDLDNQIANYKGENTSSQQAARAEALARRAAQYGV